jgi:hypothetical protein
MSQIRTLPTVCRYWRCVEDHLGGAGRTVLDKAGAAATAQGTN